MRRKLLTLLLVYIICAGTSFQVFAVSKNSPGKAITKGKPITFADKNLEKIVRDRINKPRRDIFKSDVDKMMRLDASSKDIVNLAGIESMTNLTDLFLHDNQINNIEPLKGLANLTQLMLNNNQISNIGTLKGLTYLTKLYLNDNQISNIEPIKGLTKLTILDLGGNRIMDYTPTSSYYKNLVEKDFELK